MKKFTTGRNMYSNLSFLSVPSIILSEIIDSSTVNSILSSIHFARNRKFTTDENNSTHVIGAV